MVVQGTRSLGIPRDGPPALPEGFLPWEGRRKKNLQLVTEGKSMVERSRARRESGVNTRKHEETRQAWEGGLSGWSWTCKGQESRVRQGCGPAPSVAGWVYSEKGVGTREGLGMCTDEEADTVVQSQGPGPGGERGRRALGVVWEPEIRPPSRAGVTGKIAHTPLTLKHFLKNLVPLGQRRWA